MSAFSACKASARSSSTCSIAQAAWRGAPLAAAKQQLTESLNSLDSIHQFQIVFFNHLTRTFDATGGGHRVAFATERNKQLAAKFIGGITADGGTDRLAALRAAIAMQPDVIFFLTDDDDPMPESELAEVNQLNRRSTATICTIQFGSGPPKTATIFSSSSPSRRAANTATSTRRSCRSSR